MALSPSLRKRLKAMDELFISTNQPRAPSRAAAVFEPEFCAEGLLIRARQEAMGVERS